MVTQVAKYRLVKEKIDVDSKKARPIVLTSVMCKQQTVCVVSYIEDYSEYLERYDMYLLSNEANTQLVPGEVILFSNLRRTSSVSTWNGVKVELYGEYHMASSLCYTSTNVALIRNDGEKDPSSLFMNTYALLAACRDKGIGFVFLPETGSTTHVIQMAAAWMVGIPYVELHAERTEQKPTILDLGNLMRRSKTPREFIDACSQYTGIKTQDLIK